MFETRIFGVVLCLISAISMFHGCVLLFAPNKYLPLGAWGESSIVLIRKPSLELGKRLIGLCIIIAMAWMFTRPGISLIVNPGRGSISGGDPSLPHLGPRWDLSGIGIFALICGGLLFLGSKQSVEQMFAADSTRLRDRATLRLWNLYVQLVGLFCLLWSLLPLSEFIRSLR
jgi:hypothetical protein